VEKLGPSVVAGAHVADAWRRARRRRCARVRFRCRRIATRGRRRRGRRRAAQPTSRAGANPKRVPLS
jgi:hypothetical protein